MSASEPSWVAEEAAADWMRRCGFRDATVMTGGVDTGVHVIASRAVAQVRTSLTPVGAEDLSRLVRDSRGMPGRHRILFSLSGYSEAARNYAEEHGIALLVVGRDGSVVPANAWGENLSDSRTGGGPGPRVSSRTAVLRKSGSRIGGGPLATRPEAPASAEPPVGGSAWRRLWRVVGGFLLSTWRLLWYVIGGFLLMVAIVGVSEAIKGENVGVSIGATMFCLISAWASFRYARGLERRRR